MRSAWCRRVSVVVTALALASCAGPRVHLQQGVFRAPNLFRVTVPGADWTVARATESELELRHPGSGAGIFANADCGRGPAQLDLSVLARRLFLGLRSREALENGVTTLAGLPAVHASMEAQVPGGAERMRLEAYVAKDDRCVYDLVYAAPTAAFDERHGDFRRFVASFGRE